MPTYFLVVFGLKGDSSQKEKIKRSAVLISRSQAKEIFLELPMSETRLKGRGKRDKKRLLLAR